MSALRYESNTILDIVSQMKKVDSRLPIIDYLRIKNLGILQRDKQTGRGKRGAGHKRDRKIDLIIGCNAKNLIKVPRKSNDKSFLTIGCVNVRSIRNKTSDFVTSVTDENYDICMVTETWLKEDDSAKRIECTLPGFDFLDVPRIDRNGGGTGLLAKSRLKARLVHSSCKSSFEFSEWKLKCQSGFITLIIVYRPPYSAQHPVTARTFIEEFSNYLESAIITPNKLLIGGDFNIHVNDQSDATAKTFLDLLKNYDLINHVWQPTHVAGHTLDLIITRNNNEISLDSPHTKSFISDHCFVKVVSSIEKPEVQTKEISYRKLKDINLEILKRDITASNLATSNYYNLSLTELAELYDSALSAILDEHAPIVKTVLRIKSVSPWYNSELRSIKREKRNAELKWKRSNYDADFELFKRKRNDYIKSCNNAKILYYSKKVEICDGNQKRLYQFVSKLTNGEKSIPYPDEYTKEDLCKMFGDFFGDKIDTIRSQIDATVETEGIKNVVDYSLSPDVPAFDQFKELSQEEVKDIIMESPNKYCSLDPLPTGILKTCIDVLIGPITAIVNKSLSSGEFPSCWKCAIVIPLLKKLGLELICKNYQPISNLSFVSKIVEKSALPQYVQHLEELGLYSTENSAYKQYHSTETLLAKVHSDIMNNMDKQKVTILILLDLGPKCCF